MGSIAKIVSTKIGDYVIHTLRSRLGGNVEPSLFSPAGIDAPGLPDDKAFIVRKDGSGKFVTLGTLNVSQGAAAGELILYSRDSSGAVQGKIYLNKSGEIVINGGSDYAVAFEDLKTQFNELKAAFNSHTHSGVTSGSSSTGPAAPQSAADIETVKVESVRLP